MSAKEKIKIPQKIKQQMLQHARKELPYEACGIISDSPRQEAKRFYPARNELQSKSRYHVHPEDLYRIFTEIEKRGHEIWGIFHSHPDFPAYPSETDLDQAYYPQAYYLIASFIDSEHPRLRAFRIRNRKIEEVEIETV